MSSAFLEKGEMLLINAIGLENERSLRKGFDGFTYFGCKKSIKKIKKSGMMSTGTAHSKKGSNVNDRFNA